MTGPARAVRRQLPELASRDSRAVRRAPLAPATEVLDRGASMAIAHLVAHVIRTEVEPTPENRRRLRQYRVQLRRRGRQHVAALEGALRADGGAMLRTLAAVSPDLRAAASSGAVKLLRAVAEHDVRSSTALDLLVRSVLEGVAADAALAKVLRGEGGPDDARTAERLGCACRTNLMTALAVERASRQARDADRAPIDLGAVLAAAQPTATRVAADEAGEP